LEFSDFVIFSRRATFLSEMCDCWGPEAGLSCLKQSKVGIRPPSTEQTVQCEPEAKGLPLLEVEAASRRPRFLECGRNSARYCPS